MPQRGFVQWCERPQVPIEELVPGDVVRLSAGDLIPADLRVLAARDLFLNEAALTGEAMPVEKSAATVDGHRDAPTDLLNGLHRRTPPLGHRRYHQIYDISRPGQFDFRLRHLWNLVVWIRRVDQSSATVPVVWTASGENKLRLVAG